MELPEEALTEGETSADTVGKLLASLHGTRDASANWQEGVAKCIRLWGVVSNRDNNSCIFRYDKKRERERERERSALPSS